MPVTAKASVTVTATGITTMTTEVQLFDLMSWMSPSWPIGAFAYSSGLEWGVEAGHVTDRRTAYAWTADMIEHGSLWNDTVLFVHAHRATAAGDWERLAEVTELALASLTSLERRLEATAQGAAFAKIAMAATPVTALAHFDEADGLNAYSAVVGCAAAGRGIPLAPALAAWLHASLSNLVSSAIRLVPLGQTDGQQIISELKPLVLDTVARGAALDDGDPFEAMGSATLMVEFAAMAHETQYTRLFRS
jgi:urease accessory protein